jgi:hypothetical protein
VNPDDRLADPGEEIPDERGLADARLSLDGYDPTETSAHRAPCFTQDTTLALAHH